MSYVMGFVTPVSADNKQAYIDFANQTVAYFKDLGAVRLVEAWGEDVSKGKMTDFYKAVNAEDGEAIVYAFQMFPDKATADAAGEKMMNDPAMADMGDKMPFDGARMIYAGFQTLADLRAEGQTGFIDGSVIAVPTASKAEYAASIESYFDLFKEHGAVRLVEAWGDNVPDGKVTDFKRAVAAKPDETVVMSWIEWPSREVRDLAWEKLYADPRMQQAEATYDESRRIYGGFVPVLDA